MIKMSKKKLKVEFVYDPSHDYTNMDWNFVDLADPRNSKEQKEHDERLQRHAEEQFEYFSDLGEVDIKDRDKWIEQYKKHLEHARIINNNFSIEEYNQRFDDDDEDNEEIDPDALVNVYDEKTGGRIWIPWKECRKRR